MRQFGIVAIIALAAATSCGTAGKVSDKTAGKVPGQTTDQIINEPPASQMEDVNVGYGTVKKKDLTSAVSSTKVDKNLVLGYNNIFDYLRGRVPGISIGNAGPGQTPAITIRGINSLNSSTQPLILVDGMEMADISGLNPNDVYSVEVLKDGSAAIYGSRGGNGVILITTRSARTEAAEAAAAKRAAREAAKEAARHAAKKAAKETANQNKAK